MNTESTALDARVILLLWLGLAWPLAGLAAPNIRINDVTVTEGGTANFEVSIDARPGRDQSVSIQVGTRDGTALAGQDYNARTQTLNFSRRNCSAPPCRQTFSVTTINDAVFEPTESFTANLTLLSSAKTGTIAKATGTATVSDEDTPGDVSINSTGADSIVPVTQAVPMQPRVAGNAFSVLAVNDLGMHCTDLDTRVANILPPFQVLLSQLIQKGARPVLNPAGFDLMYSAAANPLDPILGRPGVFNGTKPDGTTFKGNFAASVAGGAYDAFYPGVHPLNASPLPQLSSGGLGAVTPNDGLPVPNTQNLYLGPDRRYRSGDEFLSVVQQAMPGKDGSYVRNDPQPVLEHYTDKPFFAEPDFKFGYIAAGVNWYEAAGIPMPPFDDAGRENPYPVVRVEARNVSNAVVSTSDVVLPVSAEARCTNCHSDPSDTPDSRSSRPTDALHAAGLPVATRLQDPDQNLPEKVSREWAADVNILRLHDLKHGGAYVDTAGKSAPCDIGANGGNGTDTCLTQKALVQKQSVVCQTCHYTPALDLAQVGPLSGAAGTFANGRNQAPHQTNSRVMHNHHGQFTDLFPPMPAPIQDGNGAITNQAAREKALEESCYQCHPGKDTKCLRGAMFNGGILCNDCHGDMQKVGNDFSAGVSPQNPGAFKLGLGNFYDPASPQPRVPWANEPGCGSCHVGDANSHAVSSANVIVNGKDRHGNTDGIRLRQAYRTGDAKATPIVPANKRFAEPVVPASFNGTPNPGAGNPRLYRMSTGHGGVMCEGCHGPTHAEWPVADPNANDNLIAQQLQNHAGPISECSTCHTTSGLPATTQDGPHGMHLVNDSRFWDHDHEDLAKAQNRLAGGGTCGACHGSDHKGTVLSRVPVTRTFTVEGRTRTVAAGTPVACDLCHSLEDSFER